MVPEETRLDIEAKLLACSTGCVEPGLTRQVRGHIRAERDFIDNAELCTLVLRSLGDAPSQNIQSEDCFARARGHQCSGHGRAGSTSTMSASHVLGEAHAWHRVAVDRRPSQPLS